MSDSLPLLLMGTDRTKATEVVPHTGTDTCIARHRQTHGQRLPGCLSWRSVSVRTCALSLISSSVRLRWPSFNALKYMQNCISHCNIWIHMFNMKWKLHMYILRCVLRWLHFNYFTSGIQITTTFQDSFLMSKIKAFLRSYYWEKLKYWDHPPFIWQISIIVAGTYPNSMVIS